MMVNMIIGEQTPRGVKGLSSDKRPAVAIQLLGIGLTGISYEMRWNLSKRTLNITGNFFVGLDRIHN